MCVWMYILENLHTADGDIVKSYDRRMLIRTLESLGYLHQGYTRGYSKISQIRWLSVLDLQDKSEKQLLKEMDYQTRRNIKRQIEWVCKFAHYQLMKRRNFTN